MKQIPKFNKWYTIIKQDMTKVDVLGTPFEFNNYISHNDIPLFANIRCILHKSVYPYNCKKVYTNLYTISDKNSGYAILDKFEYADLSNVINELFSKYTITEVINTIKRAPKLKLK